MTRWQRIVGGIAVAFGLLTMVSGGSVLFGPEGVREGAGDVVGFVLWFNTISGAFYVAAGYGMLRGRAWAAPLAQVLALALVAVFAGFGWYAATGGAFEMRTVGAMTLRTGFWIAVALALALAGRRRAARP